MFTLNLPKANGEHFNHELSDLSTFLSSADFFFQKQLFRKISPGIPSEC